MPLTDAEKSFLSKGITFAQFKKGIDEYQTKADCEVFYRRLRLRAQFRGNSESDSQRSPDTADPFAQFNPKESTWTPPEGQFSAVDDYIDRCRRAINAIDFNAETLYNNLPSAERAALLQLIKRKDIVIKPADKGGTVVVWSRHLYIAEAKSQHSDGRFYQRLESDPVKVNQQVVKSTVNDMISSGQSPQSAKHLVVLTSIRTSRFYLPPKIHKENNPERPIVSACGCPTENIALYLDQIVSPLDR